MNEKEQARRPVSHPPIGIDLGTTYSAVAYIDETGRPNCIPNDMGEILTPSAILFDGNDMVIGREAVRCSVTDPEIFAECFKRDVGSDRYRKKINGISVPPEVLSAFVLERIKQDVVRRLGSLEEAVITVPAFFDERRRRATKEAGRLAGIRVLDIINEPTAAALAYGYKQGMLKGADSSQKERVLVYDLGGGTFDVSILEVSDGNFRTLATDGDVQLGGRDFDERIFNHIGEHFMSTHGVDPRSNAEDCAQLWLDAQQTKHSLSERSRIHVVVSHAGIRQRMEMTRDEFEQITADLLSRTESTTKLVMKQASLDWSQIAHVLVVGGSSRMPMVSEMLERISGKPVNRSLSPDEAIAWGATIYAEFITGINRGSDKAPLNVVNVNSHSLGIVGRDVKTKRIVVQHVIPKNTPLPHVVQKRYPTSRNRQRGVTVRIVEGESTNPDHCSHLAVCQISNLPTELPKGEKVIVEYRYESNGLINVSARIPAVRRTAAVEIKRDTSENLDSLDLWRERIRTGTTAISAPIQPSESDTKKTPVQNDRQQQLMRLDELYVLMGQIAVRNAPGKQLQQSHQMAVRGVHAFQKIRSKLAELINQQKDAQTSAERIRFSTDLAQHKEQMKTAENEARYSLIQLGRELHQTGELPQACRDYGAEVDRLKLMLQKSSKG